MSDPTINAKTPVMMGQILVRRTEADRSVEPLRRQTAKVRTEGGLSSRFSQRVHPPVSVWRCGVLAVQFFGQGA